jgi:D-3-phosphoglycerate dehydrogenase
MLRILANDGMEQSAVAYLTGLGHEVNTQHLELDELNEKLGSYDVVVIRSATKLRKETIDAVADSRLKLMIRAGVGIDNIDVAYAESKGIAVRNTPNSSSASVAELAIGHMFNLARFMHISNHTMRLGEWNKKHYTGTEISGKTLGLIGFGRIGQEIAKRAYALGMNILYNDQVGKKDGFDHYTFAEFETLLSNSDYITLHIPSSATNKPVIDAAAFEIMKKGSHLINTSRGNLIDVDAMLKALDDGTLAGAGLDVFEAEPLKDVRLMTHPKISMTPHIGASTEEAQLRIGAEVCDVITKFFTA